MIPKDKAKWTGNFVRSCANRAARGPVPRGLINHRGGSQPGFEVSKYTNTPCHTLPCTAFALKNSEGLKGAPQLKGGTGKIEKGLISCAGDWLQDTREAWKGRAWAGQCKVATEETQAATRSLNTKRDPAYSFQFTLIFLSRSSKGKEANAGTQALLQWLSIYSVKSCTATISLLLQ